MKKLALLLLTAVAVAACERKEEPNKLLDGFPSGSTEVVIPARAAQQFVVLKRDLLRVTVPVLNKLGQDRTKVSFSELTPAGFGRYSFVTVEKHYGTMTFTLEFKDPNGATIDPIADTLGTSSTTLNSVAITGTGASNEFDPITENLVLVLQSSGIVTGPLRLVGSTGFTGSSYSITFTFDSAGANALFQGLTDGNVAASGTGGATPATTALNLSFTSDRNANGTITWEGREGGIHLQDDGSGFIVATEGRILLE